jgi:CRISPR-associated endonuclease/helicase Cas3
MRALKRTEYMWHKAPLSVAEVERRLRDTRQALVIVNTRKDALRLFESLSGEHVYHLSTSMCPRHRTDVLHKVKTRLDQGKPCLLVATQLVEAGVDIDFPCVYRALGPLDSIVQAGGRCNREGTQRAGKVQVFELEDGGLPPGGYGTATGVTRTMLEGEPEGLDVDSTAVFESYFTRLYTVTELDSGKVQQYRRDFNFPEVAKSYRLIGDDTIGVVTPHVQSLYDEASCVTQPDRDFFRKLQPTQISMYNHDLTEALREGAVFPREIDGGSIYLCRPDCYDQETGFRPAYLRGDQAVT